MNTGRIYNFHISPLGWNIVQTNFDISDMISLLVDWITHRYQLYYLRKVTDYVLFYIQGKYVEHGILFQVLDILEHDF